MSELMWFKSTYSDSSGGQCVEVAIEWRKSSYSDPGGGDCVEVAVEWRKSSHSDSSGGDCVEVAAGQAAVHVRDSKDIGGPALCLPSGSWSRFLGTLRQGEGEARR